jgi:hypothetical protein
LFLVHGTVNLAVYIRTGTGDRLMKNSSRNYFPI